MGFIYILTNPSFPQYVKIGYATDVNQRLDELNRSTAVPFAFRVYATYEVAYAILEAIAEINGYTNRLKKWKASAEEKNEERLAKEIDEAHQERISPFAFSKCNIMPGEQVEFSCMGNPHDGTLCKVIDDKHVEYEGERWSLSGLATHFVGAKWTVAGPRYFKYNGEWLNEIRNRLGV